MFVDLPDGNQIWTIVANKDINDDKPPLVLLHGFGRGIGLWALNLDGLSENRTVYAFDMLGFGQSSRPKFAKTPEEAEQELVESIEQWRAALGIEKMILLGHSFGGYLVSCYALKYSHRLCSLILDDPWGYTTWEGRDPPRPDSIIFRFIASIAEHFSPLAILRVSGPLGPRLMKRSRRVFKQPWGDLQTDIVNYLYHCNARSPSAEKAFKTMTRNVIYAYKPMPTRIGSVPSVLPVTYIYGEHSWMDKPSILQAVEILKENKNDVQSFQIDNAGHNVHSDQVEDFNRVVLEVCRKVDHHHEANATL